MSLITAGSSAGSARTFRAADTFGEDGSLNFGLIGRIDTHADFIRATLHGCDVANLIDTDDD